MTALMVILITVAAFAIAMLMLGVGVMLTGKCIRGTCGGDEVVDAAGEDLRCPTCPSKNKEPGEHDEACARRHAEEAEPAATR
jgi:hypothetical protein